MPLGPSPFWFHPCGLIIALLADRTLHCVAGPTNFGPTAEAATPWMQLALYMAMRAGPVSVVFVCGQRLWRLPPQLLQCTHALLWPWNMDAVRAHVSLSSRSPALHSHFSCDLGPSRYMTLCTVIGGKHGARKALPYLHDTCKRALASVFGLVCLIPALLSIIFPSFLQITPSLVIQL